MIKERLGHRKLVWINFTSLARLRCPLPTSLHILQTIYLPMSYEA